MRPNHLSVSWFGIFVGVTMLMGAVGCTTGKNANLMLYENQNAARLTLVGVVSGTDCPANIKEICWRMMADLKNTGVHWLRVRCRPGTNTRPDNPIYRFLIEQVSCEQSDSNMVVHDESQDEDSRMDAVSTEGPTESQPTGVADALLEIQISPPGESSGDSRRLVWTLVNTKTNAVLWERSYHEVGFIDLDSPEGRDWRKACEKYAMKHCFTTLGPDFSWGTRSESPRQRLAWTDSCIILGDAQYEQANGPAPEEAYRAACNLYRHAMVAAQESQSESKIAAAGWRLATCLLVLRDKEQLQKTFADTFSTRVNGQPHAKWRAADFVVAWAVGRCQDVEFVKGLNSLMSTEGSALAWFLIGERYAASSDSSSAAAAYQKSAKVGSTTRVWTSRWASMRLAELNVTNTTSTTTGP